MVEYVERDLLRQRRFRLTGEYLEIRGVNGWWARYETRVPLRDLRVERDTVYLRSDLRSGLSALPGTLAVIVLAIFSVPISAVSEGLLYAMLGLAALGMALGFLAGGKSKYYVYHYKGGGRAFDIGQGARGGPEFEDFCRYLDERLARLGPPREDYSI